MIEKLNLNRAQLIMRRRIGKWKKWRDQIVARIEALETSGLDKQDFEELLSASLTLHRLVEALEKSHFGPEHYRRK